MRSDLESWNQGQGANVDESDVRHLRRAIELARLARAHGNHPFGSLLVDASGRVLAERCEHCPMSAAGTWWAGIGRIVFALSAAQFRELLAPGAPSLTLDARELFARGNRRVLVEGPCPELEAEARAVHAGFWR